MQDPDISDIVVCFMVSGDTRYVSMTLRAVKSFQENTPSIPVGLLVDKSFDHAFFVAQLPNPSLVTVKHYTHHFDWNPTQYKLDIIQFADKFKTIIWLDSDILVHRDITNFLLSFHRSNKNYAFTLDHVNHSEDFRRRWVGNRDSMFVPQACFMGFKAEAMKPFFEEWEKKWKEWIHPFPFANYPDPNPSFPHSQFCIEQYALGQVIEVFVENVDIQIFFIPREQMFVRNVNEALEAVGLGGELGGGLVGGLTDQLSQTFSTLALQRPIGVQSSYSSSYSTSSYASTSYRPTSYSSYGPTSYSSYGPTSYRSTSYSSYRTSSYASSYGVSSYRVSSYGPSSYGVSSYGGSSYGGSSYGSSYASTSYNNQVQTQQHHHSFTEIATSPPLDDRLMVDNFASGVVHYYSINYEQFFSPTQEEKTETK